MVVVNTLQTLSWMGLHRVKHKSCSLDNQSLVYKHMEVADMDMGVSIQVGVSMSAIEK